MEKEDYIKILDDNVKASAEKLQLGPDWTYQQDNDPKHTTKVVKQWFKDNDVMISNTDTIQLTNWILWNGKFYYRDVIKITITRAKGEGNGHFYHIEMIDLPFYTIPFVSCFISLIDNTKKLTFIENLQANLR